MENQIEIHPEIKKLLEEYNKLKDEIAKLIEEKEHIVTTVIPNLEAEYKVKIGYLEYKCFVFEIEIRRLNREIQIRQAAANRGQNIDEAQIKKQLEKEFEAWKIQIEDMKNEIDKADRYLKIPTMTKEESAEFKKLYRNIVKKLHPDINPNVTENEKLLWLRVNEFYSNVILQELTMLRFVNLNRI